MSREGSILTNSLMNIDVSRYSQRDWGVGDVEENNSSGSVTMPSVVDLERYGECCILLRKLPAWMTRKALEVFKSCKNAHEIVLSDK